MTDLTKMLLLFLIVATTVTGCDLVAIKNKNGSTVVPASEVSDQPESAGRGRSGGRPGPLDPDIIPPNGPFWKYGTITMGRNTRKAGMKPAVFAHWSHRAKYTCRVCHLDLGISMRAGMTGISRSQYLAGNYCGACHDGKTAFTVKDGPQAQCGKCHLDDPKVLETAFEKFAATLPLSRFGNGIDWVQATKEGKIAPQDSLSGEKRPMVELPPKLRKPLLLTTTTPRSDVVFSHEEHFKGLDCAICHPDIFNIKKKGTKFSMEANLYGSYCGACHMQVAFYMRDCRRCHPSMSTH